MNFLHNYKFCSRIELWYRIVCFDSTSPMFLPIQYEIIPTARLDDAVDADDSNRVAGARFAGRYSGFGRQNPSDCVAFRFERTDTHVRNRHLPNIESACTARCMD